MHAKWNFKRQRVSILKLIAQGCEAQWAAGEIVGHSIAIHSSSPDLHQSCVTISLSAIRQAQMTDHMIDKVAHMQWDYRQ